MSYTAVYITNTKAGLYLEAYLLRTRVLQVMIQSVLLLFGLLTLLYILSCENRSSDFLKNWLVFSQEPEYMQC